MMASSSNYLVVDPSYGLSSSSSSSDSSSLEKVLSINCMQTWQLNNIVLAILFSYLEQPRPRERQYIQRDCKESL